VVSPSAYLEANDDKIGEKEEFQSMVINIPEEVALRLEKLAEQQGSTVGDLLRTLLDRYVSEIPPGSLAEMAQNAREAGLASDEVVETAERSREILNTEYVDYLKRRRDK
jgi:predicted DNA-binding protein